MNILVINCGSSSKLVARIILPIRVTRVSPFSEYTPLPWDSALTHIDLNFNIVNSFPSRPRRTCLNKAGPRESSLIANAMINIGKAKTTIPMKDSTISINRLKKCLYIFVETNFQKIIFYEKHPKSTAKAASRTCRMQLQALQHRRQSLLLPRVQKAKNILHLRSQFVAQS